MQTAGRESRERRALNIVWTAAGEYGFRPDFLAFQRDGTPDVYLNSIVGLAHRFYDAEKLAAYVRQLDRSLLHEIFEDILWLGIEQAVYQRELPVRPALAELRQQHARQFLRDDIDVSMQSLMLRSEIVHTLKAGRCHEILGGPTGIRNPWDKCLYAALDYPAEITTDEIIQRTEGILRRFFVFRLMTGQQRSWHIPLGSCVSAWLRRFVPHEAAASVQRLGNTARSAAGHGSVESCPLPAEDAMAKVRRDFGVPLLPEAERLRIEQELCRGSHRKVRLYYAKGGANPASLANRGFWQEQQVRCRLVMRQLCERLKSCLSVYQQPLALPAHKGRFTAGRVWRAVCLEDSRVFTAWQVDEQSDFDVTLLLDASESRRAQQGTIAAQAYAIAMSLMACRIPVQVLAFCSLSGITVLSQLKDFAAGDAEGVFDYATRGWNRDGLALPAAAKLLRQAAGRQQLLLVLTDANPSDELGLPLAGGLMSRRYMDTPAIQDTAAAAKALRQQGIRLIGLVNSTVAGEGVSSAAREIYGQQVARIERIEQLAAAVGRLIEQQVQQGAALKDL
ncbi:hypothetical protein SAMN02910356_01838 [Selenomonas sp. GACV-9]|uniref:hypothetical protein n=1 Tax=Selenomonas sp. GACV-9 TaxID=3158782 RepID=UPI0008E19C39|nr:hypothetical protein SAMN02910356_01838 [Selenomonas ruminantium]